jgi:DNA-binding winged helix-turn-helix (wHTH) protein
MVARILSLSATVGYSKGASGGSTVPLLFGDCLFDPDRRVLSRAAQEVHLTPKAFRLLELLIEKRPNPVSKSELMSTLWPDAVVAEGSLSNLVAEVRDALGDSARGGRYLRTFHRFGYAFCGEAVRAPSFDMPLRIHTTCRLETPTGPIVLREGDNTIGREEGCEVSIASTTVSRRHARIHLAAGQAMIEDLGSKNGTLVKGVKIQGLTELFDGDSVEVGSVRLIFRTSAGSKTTDSIILSPAPPRE